MKIGKILHIFGNNLTTGFLMVPESVFDRREINEGFGDSVFTRMIKAGHRTYFLDVKTTRTNDYFLIITELRKKITSRGIESERNKVFLYKEDFEKFAGCFAETLEFVRARSKAEDCESKE